MSWKTRTATATTAVALLTGGGIAALAHAAPQSSATATSSPVPERSAATPPATDDTAQLAGSLHDLMTRVDGLQATLAAAPLPAAGPHRAAGETKSTSTPPNDHAADNQRDDGHQAGSSDD